MRLLSPFLLLLPPVLIGMGLSGCRKEPPPATAAAEQTAAEPEVETEKPPAIPGSSTDKVIKAVQDGDRAALLEQWSTGALVEDLVRRGVLKDLDDVGKAAAKAAVEEHFDLLFSYLSQSIGETNLPAAMGAGPDSLPWKIYHTRNEGWDGSKVVRYWTVSEEGDEQLVDFEDLATGRRASTILLPLLVPADTPWRAPLIELLAELSRAGNADPFETAGSVIKEVARLLAADPPAEVRAFALKLKAEALISQGLFEDALKTAGQFGKIQPGSPWADYLRGIALMRLDRCFEAITAFRRFASATSCDELVNESIGWCHFYEGDEASALNCAMLGLKHSHGAYGSLLLAVLTSKPDQISALAPHFTNVFDPESVFDYILNHLVSWERADAAGEVMRILEKQLPDSKLVAVYRKRIGELPE